MEQKKKRNLQFTKNGYKFLYLIGLCVVINISNTGFAIDSLIWRSIPINNGKLLSLSSPIESICAVTAKHAQRGYHLLKGTFMGADSIAIQTDERNLIARVSFHYDLTYGFEDYLKSFEKALRKADSLIKKGKRKTAIWQDGYTRFSLFYRRKGQKSTLYSILEDL